MGYSAKLSNLYSPDNNFFKERFLTKKEANVIALGADEKENNINFERMVYYILKEIKKLAENGVFEWDICVRNNTLYKKNNDIMTMFIPIKEDTTPGAYQTFSPLLYSCPFYKENTQDSIQFLESLGYNAYLTVDSDDMRTIHIDWK